MNAEQDALLRLLPLLPLVAVLVHAACIGVLRRALPDAGVWAVSCAGVGGAFLLSLVAFFRLVDLPEGERVLADTVYTWIGAGIGNSRVAVDLGFRLDPMAAFASLLATGLSTVVHVYAMAFMETDTRDDRGTQRFFCYLGLATLSLLVLVLADNLVLFFLGWEGLAVASWLLVAFWYNDADNARFGGQAFLTGRIGDFGFLVGTLMLFAAFLAADLPASLFFAEIRAALPELASLRVPAELPLLGEAWQGVDVVALCFFLAAAARAGLLPFSAWLPRAVAGPIPGATLVVAVTTLGAGLYLMCRLAFVFAASSQVPPLIAWAGAATALYATLCACAQLDLRRVLALLALGEVGLLFVAVGCGAFTAALLHFMSYGFVLTLLLLAAGSVSRATQGEMELTRLGDLGRRLPHTLWSFRVGAAVLAGMPLGSVFFSRGTILGMAESAALPAADLLHGVALLSVVFTAFAIWRAYWLVFSGEPRLPIEVRERVEESPRRMRWLLFALAAAAAFGGAFGIPQYFGDAVFAMDDSHSLANFMADTLVAQRVPLGHDAREAQAALYAVLAGGLGFGAAYLLYRGRPSLAHDLAERTPVLRGVLQEAFYLERASEVLSLRFIASRLVDDVLERRVMVGGALGLGSLLRVSATRGLRHLQAGFAHGYVFFMIVGTAAVLGYLLR